MEALVSQTEDLAPQTGGGAGDVLPGEFPESDGVLEIALLQSSPCREGEE